MNIPASFAAIRHIINRIARQAAQGPKDRINQIGITLLDHLAGGNQLRPKPIPEPVNGLDTGVCAIRHCDVTACTEDNQKTIVLSRMGCHNRLAGDCLGYTTGILRLEYLG